MLRLTVALSDSSFAFATPFNCCENRDKNSMKKEQDATSKPILRTLARDEKGP